MSHVHRLRLSERIFFVTVNLRHTIAPLSDPEYAEVVAAIEQSRRKLHFLFLGYVLMPDHWHALIWPTFPLTICRVVQDVKWISARRLNQDRDSSGPIWQHQFWDRFVRHAREFLARLDCTHLNPCGKGSPRDRKIGRGQAAITLGWTRQQSNIAPYKIDYVHLPDSYRV